jgi:hypothetical protein
MTRPSLSDYGTYDESTVPRLWDGVVGAWCPSLGPTGSRLHDFSRFNNWGTLTNMDAATDWVISSSEYGLDFDGSNDGVLIGTNERLNPANYCVSLWFTPNVVTAGQKSIYSQINAAGSSGKAIRRNAASLEFTVAAGNSVFRVWTSNATFTATLTHGVISWDSSGTPRMWINGVESAVTLAATSGTTPAPAAQPLYIGCDGAFGQTDPNYNFAGVVFSVLHWNRLLTPNEVSELYLLGRGGMFQRRRVRRAYVVETGNRRRRLICGAEC